MAYATYSDVKTILGRDLTTDESGVVGSLLDSATDLLIGYLGCEKDPVPDTVKRVCAAMVARVFEQDSAFGVESVQQGAGPYQETVKFASGSTYKSPWLIAGDKVRLRPFRCGGGARSVSAYSEQTGRYRSYR